MATVSPTLPSSFENFDLLNHLKLDYTPVSISQWRSRVTGLRVVHLDYEAPIVSGYFVVATEIFNDSGCPHTLEHLVFMGSEKYPYKGIIDQLANRGFSNGTNAWTDTDHTAYTVSTAGEQGFLQILPVYVDHILYPTLTKAGFLTEVHHIDPKGHDAGVVYSEMQGRENTSGDLMALRMQRLLHPMGSGYRSETGGLMEALRNLTVDQIREYHRTYYVPHNFSLIVAGKLSSGTTSLLSVLQSRVEPSIIAHNQTRGPKPEGWKRPFVETQSAVRGQVSEDGVKRTVEFPEKDESVGELIITFEGPPRDDQVTRKALDLIGTYLTSSPVAPLNKEYVEIEEPLCTYIYFDEDARVNWVDLPVYIGSIPTHLLDAFDAKFRNSLQRIVREGIDMTRMAMVINRDERQFRSQLESAKGDAYSGTIIEDFLYGPEGGVGLKDAVDQVNHYKHLRTWSGSQWADLIRTYYLDRPSVVVRGKPSAAMAERLEKDEKARIAAQIESLGPGGLERAEKALEVAKEEHARPIPEEMLTSFPVPEVDSISFIPVQSYQEKGKDGKGKERASVIKIEDGNEELLQHIEADGSALPFAVEFDHVKSEFVSIHALFSLATLPDHLRPYIPIYLSSFFSLAVSRGSGVHLTHEEVVNKLDDETVSYEVGLGVSGYFSEALRVSIKVEPSMYESAVEWLKDLVYGSEFNKERLQVTIAKLQQALPEQKRDGNTVLSSYGANLLFDESSTSRAGGIVNQVEFIPKVAKQLQEDPATVIEEMLAIRKSLTQPSGVRMSVTGNILGVTNPRSVWQRCFGDAMPPTDLAPLRTLEKTLSDVGRVPSKKALVVSLPTIESSYVTHTTKGIQGFDDADYPVLRVALEVLNATESYLWKYIRGSGLAYGAYVSADKEAGLLSFSLYRSSNSLQAYTEAARVVRGLVDGSIELEETVLDAAKSSIVYGVTKGISTPGRAALTSFMHQGLMGLPKDYTIELLEKCRTRTKEDVLGALRRWFLPLFDPATSVAVVVAAPSKVDEIVAGLSEAGFNPEKRALHVDADDLECSEGASDEDMSGSESDSESSDSFRKEYTKG